MQQGRFEVFLWQLQYALGMLLVEIWRLSVGLIYATPMG